MRWGLESVWELRKPRLAEKRSRPVWLGLAPALFFVGSIFVDPSQISCIDVNGVAYQPFDVDEAGDLVVASKAFQNWAKGSVSGAVMGSLLGSALGSVLGSIGRQDSTQKGVLLGSGRFIREDKANGANTCFQ